MKLISERVYRKNNSNFSMSNCSRKKRENRKKTKVKFSIQNSYKISQPVFKGVKTKVKQNRKPSSCHFHYYSRNIGHLKNRLTFRTRSSLFRPPSVPQSRNDSCSRRSYRNRHKNIMSNVNNSRRKELLGQFKLPFRNVRNEHFFYI